MAGNGWKSGARGGVAVLKQAASGFPTGSRRDALPYFTGWQPVPLFREGAAGALRRAGRAVVVELEQGGVGVDGESDRSGRVGGGVASVGSATVHRSDDRRREG